MPAFHPCRWAPAALLLLAALPLRAEVITLRDGSTFDGTIENRTSNGFDLHVHYGGISTIKHINIMDITDIGPSAPPPPPPPAPRAVAATRGAAPGAASRPAAAAVSEKPAFFKELLDSALGHGPDELSQFPRELQDQWNAVLRSEVLGNRPETLNMMRKMEDAFAAIPHGVNRLDAIVRKTKKMSFGQWEAQIHWDAMYSRMTDITVDVGDIRDEEKEPLVGLLKEKTGPALEPIKPYFPPTDPKTGRPQAFNPKQLSGLNPGNAAQMKEKASWAATVLLAQLKVEPDMPEADRAVILTQLTTVRRVLARANELVPLAKSPPLLHPRASH